MLISVAAVKFKSLLDAIVKSVPSPSIFSPSSPNVTPISEPTLISPLAPTVIVKSVPSDSIFSAVAKVSPLLTGIFTSAVGDKLILLPVIVKSVPSPSIFSPSSPKVIPISEPIFISPPAPTVIDKSVPSDSIFSAVANVSPTPDGIFTSSTAVRLILFPAIVKSVPSPSIFSPSLPKVNPIFAGMFISPLAPTFILKSVPSLLIYSPLSW